MNRKNWIKVLIIMVIIAFVSFSNWTFATDVEDFEILGWSLDYIVSVLWWIWVFFAKLAWTFLTNQWVYGEVLWLDALFWKLRNLIKNIANFWLWFYLVYTILKWLLKWNNEEIVKKLKDNILWLLIAWVWIQASWFFTAVVIDVSTVTLVAAWSFPAQMISENPYIEWSIKKSLSEVVWKKISLFSKDYKSSSYLETVWIDTTKSDDEIVDIMLPNEKDVAWPLYFIWFSILKTNVITSVDNSSVKGIKATILNVIIQWWTTVVFALEMLVLCILAIMRIIYLWIFIVMSPLAVLLWCIEKARKKESWGSGKWFLDRFTNQINFRSFFINAFKPTFIVLAFWIATIFVSLMNQVVLDYSKFDIKWAELVSCEDSTNVNWNEWDKKYLTVMNDDYLTFTLRKVWKSLLEVALSVVTVLIVYVIISIAVKMWGWTDFVSSRIKKIQEGVGWIIESAPVIPVSWYDEQWLDTTRYISARKVFGDGTSSIIEDKINSYQWKILDKYNDQNNVINSWFWNSKNVSLPSVDRSKIEGKWAWNQWLNILEEQKKTIYELRDKNLKSWEWYWMILDPTANDKFWANQFEKWLTNMKDRKGEIIWSNSQYWRAMVDWWNDENNKGKRNFQSLFQNRDYVKAYADLFELNLSSYDWEHLKNADISKKS